MHFRVCVEASLKKIRSLIMFLLVIVMPIASRLEVVAATLVLRPPTRLMREIIIIMIT